MVDTTPNEERTYKVHHGTITIYDGVVNFDYMEVKERIFHVDEETKLWIEGNLKKSQFGEDRPYIYIESFVNWWNNSTNDNEEEKWTKLMDEGENTFDKIREWAEEKGIYGSGDVKTQYFKLMEEAGELAEAILKDDTKEVHDAIGDMVVVLTNLAELYDGTSIEYCIDSAYDVISKRTGKMINGTFVKDE